MPLLHCSLVWVPWYVQNVYSHSQTHVQYSETGPVLLVLTPVYKLLRNLQLAALCTFTRLC